MHLEEKSVTKVFRDVGSVLDGRALVILAPDQTIREAAVVLSAQQIGAAPVMDGGKLVGVFSERDVLKRVVARDRDAAATSVGDVMTPQPRTTTPQTSLARAFGLMVDGSFRHLPVVGDDGQVIAMLSMRDIPPEYRLLHQRWREWTSGPSATTPVRDRATARSAVPA